MVRVTRWSVVGREIEGALFVSKEAATNASYDRAEQAALPINKNRKKENTGRGGVSHQAISWEP